MDSRTSFECQEKGKALHLAGNKPVKRYNLAPGGEKQLCREGPGVLVMLNLGQHLDPVHSECGTSSLIIKAHHLPDYVRKGSLKEAIFSLCSVPKKVFKQLK